MSKHTPTDRELLERAAKAAGITVWRGKGHQSDMLFTDAPPHDSGLVTGVAWRPLDDSGQALELAVKLRMNLDLDSDDTSNAFVPGGVQGYACDHGADPLAATRRAVVRAAAAISEGEQK